MPAIRAPLSGSRWHFQHGPIDLVVEADGEVHAVAVAHEAAWRRFVPLLDELVAELPSLKRPVGETCPLNGTVARTMWRACAPHRTHFVTPMAAVAGAVADALIGCYRRGGIRRAWVNNGGDIALHLAPGASVHVGLVADLARFDPRAWRGRVDVDGGFEITHAMAVRGIATSGWRGRSFSRGIADSVTVLARTAAEADAAATMIANAVDVDDARIVRAPASTLKDDSDLADLAVTVDVPVLGAEVVRRALQAGLARAEAMRRDGLVVACAIVCQGMRATTCPPPLSDERRPVRRSATTLEAA
jgi:ApbE superfamily uncharacterized protein (UPF0280 family)